MKIGIAKDDYGISLTGIFWPINNLQKDDKANEVLIKKGERYYVPDNYDFDEPTALFYEEKQEKQEKRKKEE